MSEWHPIETAPKDGTYILAVWARNKTTCLAFWDEKEWNRVGSGGIFPIEATHWMPLPEPPNA